MPAEPTRGLLDTNILALRRWIPPEHLPEEMAISAVTVAELAAGVHLVDGDDETANHERARRVAVLQQTENEFDAVTFDTSAARMFGQMAASLKTAGRTPRRRALDLMIAATAAVHQLPVYTTNPDDFAALDELVEVVPVSRPPDAP
ncbi:MAG: type II toxin-antitoxin system VapC family toxin [Micrococcales bacterium]|nr:type II toxin-antitoxin system VapC family toxin [Micrococcales bacterium]